MRPQLLILEVKFVKDMNDSVTISLVSLAFAGIGIFVLYVLHKFANFKKNAWYVLLTTFIGWFLSFGIVLLIPLDVSSVQIQTNLVE